LKWYLVRSKSGQEERVLFNLTRQDITTYCPKVKYQGLANKPATIKPLFPSYVFIQIDIATQSTASIGSTYGVIGLVKFGYQLAEVSDALIEQLKQHEKLIAEPVQSLKKGDALIIDQPSFNQLEAVFHEPNGQQRSYLLIEILGKQKRISVSNSDLRRR